MRTRARRLQFRPNPPGGYDGQTAYEGAEAVGRVDWCRGKFHVQVYVDRFGYAGAYVSEMSAKSMLRRYLRQARRHQELQRGRIA